MLDIQGIKILIFHQTNEEIINALPRRVEDGLPYVGRNRGPTSTFSTI
jgi:hypothetical protein